MHNFKWLLSSPITGAHISQDLFIATRPARDDSYFVSYFGRHPTARLVAINEPKPPFLERIKQQALEEIKPSLDKKGLAWDGGD
jgi:hypothetical protein